MYGEGDAENGGLSEHTRDEKDHIVMKIADYDVTIDWRNRVSLIIINWFLLKFWVLKIKKKTFF